jgi:hypothetical protein
MLGTPGLKTLQNPCLCGRQVLCASDEAHTRVDPVDPPAAAAVGERVTFEGYGAEPEPVLNPKKKVFEKLAPDLRTDAGMPLLPAYPKLGIYVYSFRRCPISRRSMCRQTRVCPCVAWENTSPGSTGGCVAGTHICSTSLPLPAYKIGRRGMAGLCYDLCRAAVRAVLATCYQWASCACVHWRRGRLAGCQPACA